MLEFGCVLGVNLLLVWFGKNPKKQGKEDSGVFWGRTCEAHEWSPEMTPENSCDPSQASSVRGPVLP